MANRSQGGHPPPPLHVRVLYRLKGYQPLLTVPEEERFTLHDEDDDFELGGSNLRNGKIAAEQSLVGGFSPLPKIPIFASSLVSPIPRAFTHKRLLALVAIILVLLALYLMRTNLNMVGSNPAGAFFLRPNASAHIDCGRVMAGDTDYIATLTSRRVTHTDAGEGELAMDCELIRARHYFPPRPLSAAEARWPWAQARVVFRDYEMLEEELASAYAPQNWYCYAVDAKADPVFRQRVHALADCLPNVVVATEEMEVNSWGHGYFPSIMNCLRELAIEERRWEYVTLLQNYDIQIRTNAEAVRILQWLDGANDVEIVPIPWGRYDPNLDWSFSALRLFRNETRNLEPPTNGHPPVLPVSKGYAQASLTRAMADFMVHHLDLTEFIQRQEERGQGVDEQYIATLDAADSLQAPGGFTRACIEKGVGLGFITRLSLWDPGPNCRSNIWRNGICIFGVEDLHWLATGPVELFANKLMPEMDAGALACWREWMFNRTYYQRKAGKDKSSIATDERELSREDYSLMAQVRFQEFKRKHGTTASALEEFQCKLAENQRGKR